MIDVENRISKEIAISYDSINKWAAIEAIDSITSIQESNLVFAREMKYKKLTPRKSFDFIYDKLVENDLFKLNNLRNHLNFPFYP